MKNYFRVALRTLIRNRSYATINIFGLALGIAGASMLMLYVNSELSFDDMHAEGDRMYRVITENKQEGGRQYATTWFPLTRIIEQDVPEVEEIMTFYQNRGQINFRLGHRRITEESWYMVDANFFEFFDFELVSGSPAGVLAAPNSIVLSESLAKKYFGDANPIGRTINEFDWGDFTVTGIFKDLPEHSHVQFDLLIDANMTRGEEWASFRNEWSRYATFSYVKLAQGATAEAMTEKVAQLMQQHRGEQAEDFAIHFQALKDIHFESANIERGLDNDAKGDRSYVFIFSSIALFLLIIAAVNYTNLATSKAIFRSKEIGVRKVVGAQKQQLILQFLSESTLITLSALVISIGLIDLALPYFNSITGRSFSLGWSELSETLPILFLTTVIVGLMSGLYPAFFVTRFQPAQVLKGTAVKEGKGSLKQVLVIVQFSLSMIMIIATLVVSGQMNFIRNSSPGYTTDGVLVIDINSFFTRRDFKLMKTEFAKIPEVQHVAVASRVPGEWKRLNEVAVIDRNTKSPTDSVQAYYMGFDHEMINVFDFDLVMGEYFSGDDQRDSTKVLLNRSAVKAMGIRNPIGAQVYINRQNRRALNATVIGVLDDFKYESMHSAVAPLVIGSWNSGIRSIDYFALKVSTKNVSQLVDDVTWVHNQYDPATTIEYNFLEAQLAAKYEAEQRAGTIFKAGAGLSIIVACLGLFGLASFTVQRRTKELGIRKVLGASHWNIFYILSSSFTRLILVAILLASPIAYLLMSSWLDNFEYRIGLGPGVFLLAGGTTILVALLSVSYLSLRAVVVNPVHSLKDE